MQLLHPENFEAATRRCVRGNVIPVTLVVSADLQTPFGVYLLLRQTSPNSFLLESIEGGESLARYSFVGANPRRIFRGRGGKTTIHEAGKTSASDKNLLASLREHFENQSLAGDFDSPPLAGGLVGFFNFEAVGLFEPSLAVENADEGMWLQFDTTVAFDHARQQIRITTLVFPRDGELTEAEYDSAVKENYRVAGLLEETPVMPSNFSDSGSAEIESNFSQADFVTAVDTVKDHILAGDCYQVVISQKFSRKSTASAVEIYRSLRSLNPSPYMFLVEFEEKSVIGASPEMLVRCRGRNAEYRPIAGTRPRGSGETEDRALAKEMMEDKKETAEHLMLVDLGRNDLGRIAKFGTVAVQKLLTVEKYSHVQHLVSALTCELKDDCDAFDALAACFPAGTVSGAPKIRAIDIIRAIEPEARALYAGAVGYADYAGNLDTCIAIRTIVLRDGVASVQAGAGIVADSVPESEFAETEHKARGLWRAIEAAERKIAK
jgi:anthranilate synthase component I